MNCPHCKTPRLKATRLDQGLPALGCENCGGTLIPLLAYRDWSERTAQDQLQSAFDFDRCSVSSQDSRAALSCPKCSGLMTKYLINDSYDNRLDLCNHCDEAWLDGGEWELLKALQLSKQLPKIFTDNWQQQIKHNISEDKLKQRYIQLVGEQDIEKAAVFRAWLNQHDKRAELLFFISQK